YSVKNRNNNWMTICVASNKCWRSAKSSFLTQRCLALAISINVLAVRRQQPSSKMLKCCRVKQPLTTDLKGGRCGNESQLLVWKNDDAGGGRSRSTDPQ